MLPHTNEKGRGLQALNFFFILFFFLAYQAERKLLGEGIKNRSCCISCLAPSLIMVKPWGRRVAAQRRIRLIYLVRHTLQDWQVIIQQIGKVVSKARRGEIGWRCKPRRSYCRPLNFHLFTKVHLSTFRLTYC